MVLPVPVPPLMRNARRPSIIDVSSSAISSLIDPAAMSDSTVKVFALGIRSEIVVPPVEIGDSTQCSRVPSRNCASTMGAASSSLLPAVEASRCANRLTSLSELNAIPVNSRPNPRSHQTALGPFTNTSVTPRSSSNGCRTPAPLNSRSRTSASSSADSSLRTTPSSRNAWKTWVREAIRLEAMRRLRTRLARAWFMLHFLNVGCAPHLSALGKHHGSQS